MRKITGAFIAALAVGALYVGGASAASLGGAQSWSAAGSGDMLTRVDYSCGHLRHECREERERGYEGGACHRYHEECGDEHCRRLRHACHEESENGDHEGACHRYLEECEER